MKRLFVLLMVLVLAVSAVACASAPAAEAPAPEVKPAEPAPEAAPATEPAAEDDAWKDELSEPDKLVIAIESSWVPFCYTEGEDADEVIGYCADMVKALSERLGLECEFMTSSSYDTLLAAVDAGRADILYQVAASNEKYFVTQPHLFMRKALTVAKDNEEIKSFEDLDGKLTGNALGGSNATVAEMFGCEVTKSTTPEAMELIINGRVDCNIDDEIAINVYFDTNPEMLEKVKVVAFYADEAEGSAFYKGFGVSKDKPALYEKVNAVCQEMLADGSFYDIGATWFGADVMDAMPMYRK